MGKKRNTPDGMAFEKAGSTSRNTGTWFRKPQYLGSQESIILGPIFLGLCIFWTLHFLDSESLGF